jgi:hypothetical protein
MYNIFYLFPLLDYSKFLSFGYMRNMLLTLLRSETLQNLKFCTSFSRFVNATKIFSLVEKLLDLAEALKERDDNIGVRPLRFLLAR